MSEGIYLDNNATTMVSPEVVQAMLPYFTEQFGNPSSIHQFGNKVGLAIKAARKQVQKLLGAEHDSEIVSPRAAPNPIPPRSSLPSKRSRNARKSSPPWSSILPF